MSRSLSPARILQRIVEVRDEEVRALLWSFAYFFCLLCAYYILRPLRDEMGIAGGVRNLHWLFTATFVTMLAAVPLYGAAVARMPRARFIPMVYRFFIANILIFWALLTLDVAPVHVARIFFVWISVFNLFVISVFWSFMADLFRSEQGKRLFGFIAAGGSAGALLGPSVTVALAAPLGPVNLLLISALLLELAVVCARRLQRISEETAPPAAEDAAAAPPCPAPARCDRDRALGGGMLNGILLILRSPYLAGICLWVFLLTLAGTFLYFQQAEIVRDAFADPADRVRIFAAIDLAVGLLTVAVQLAATGRLITRFGVGPAAAFLPLIAALGFLALAIAPVLSAVIAFQAAQRAANFAISNPAREILFTVVGREQKYKSKNVIDTVVFRGGDAVSGWMFAGLRGMGLELAAIALLAVPVMVLWLAVALLLGRTQERLAAASTG
ncbi:MAG: MFS transporter [Alphaproteobacteria bacterium]|nr:MFS transporter [Alphaproteobacteria bacterium]